MRIDLTVRGADDRDRDVAVLAPTGSATSELAALLTPGRAQDGLRVGEIRTSDAPGRGSAIPATHRLEIVGGPSSGRALALRRDPMTVGRWAGCDLVLPDPGVSRVHAELVLTANGPTVRDLGSANGTTLDGASTGSVAVSIAAGQYLRLGDTYLQVCSVRTRTAPTRPGADGTVLVSRPPRTAVTAMGEEIVVPTAPASAPAQHLGWISVLVPAAAGVALAVALHAPQYLLFSLLSPIAWLATAFGDRLHWRRERRRRAARYRTDLAAAQRRIARALTREQRSRRILDQDPAAVLRTACGPGARLWERPRGPGQLRVRLGVGDVLSQTQVRIETDVRPAGRLSAVPVTVDLADGALGVSGPRQIMVSVARWLLGQLATQVSPADLELALFLSAPTEPSWHWARWLPHLRERVAVGPAERRSLLTELTEERDRRRARSGPWPGPCLLVIVDVSGGATDIAGLAGLLTDGPAVGITAVCLAAHRAQLPAICRILARATGETGTRLEISGTSPVEVVADGVDIDWADELARALAPLRDPGGADGTAIPDTCRLLPLLELSDPSADSVLDSWGARPGLTTTLGIATDGPLTIDLVRDGPHALIAGTTGAGKSELLRTLIAGLAARHPPESVAFVLVDYKGGAALADCARLPHTVGLVTDLDPHLAERALQSLGRELTRREELFAGCGARDLEEYRGHRPREPVPRLVIVIDEFAELAAELGEFVSGLVAIARRGRSLGVHLVLATQRPSGVISPEIRANTSLRIALRVTDPGESRDVIDIDDASSISRHDAGRAFLRRPGAPAVLLQTAWVGGAAVDEPRTPRVVPLDRWRRLPPDRGDRAPTATDLERLVTAARGAANRSERPAPRSPWLAPLPDRIARTDLAAGEGGRIALGLCDRPWEQQQVPLYVDLHRGGSLLLAGGPRSGRTSALLTLAIAAAHDFAPAHLHVHVLDFGGDGLAALSRLPHCGSLVAADLTTAAILISRLEQEILDRQQLLARAPDRGLPWLLCLLDGWDAFATAGDEHDGGRTVERFCGLVRAGPSVGLTIAVAGDRSTLAVRLSSCVVTKLLLKLTDRADYTLAGIASRAIPTAFSPGRAVRAEDGVEIQLAHLGRDPSPAERATVLEHAVLRWTGSAPGDRPPIRVRPLPGQVALPDLYGDGATLRNRATDGDRVILGVGGDGADPVAVDLFAGAARLLVAGPPRSGRSTIVDSLLRQLAGAGCAVVVAAPARSPVSATALECGVRLVRPGEQLAAYPSGERTALLVDDCEAFVDTATGDELTTWIRTAGPGLAVVATGISDELAVTFRGIAGEVRRARCTLLLHPSAGDADLVGTALPRHRSGRPPGRGVLAGDRAWGPLFAAGPVPIQIARP